MMSRSKRLTGEIPATTRRRVKVRASKSFVWVNSTHHLHQEVTGSERSTVPFRGAVIC
jgi:hypothetical protein